MLRNQGTPTFDGNLVFVFLLLYEALRGASCNVLLLSSVFVLSVPQPPHKAVSYLLEQHDRPTYLDKRVYRMTSLEALYK